SDAGSVAADGASDAVAAADRGHRTLGLLEVRMVDPVAGPLAPQVATDQFDELLVGGPVTERAPQVGLLEREQAGPHLPLRRDPQAVAGLAERFGDAADHPAPAGRAVGEAIARRGLGAGPVGDERVDGVDRSEDPGRRADLRALPRVLRVEQHVLDEPDSEAA